MNPPVFILSDFRSGSTLLRYSLDAHPDICCPAELGLAHFCQELFRIVELTTDAPSGETHRADHAARVQSVRMIADQLMHAYCLRKGKQRWCEKSPSNTNALNILSVRLSRCLCSICLYRHALDQVHSFLELDDEQRLQGFLARNANNPLAAAIDRWCGQTEKLLSFEHLHAARACRVHYETFVGSPDAELRRLMRFVSVPPIDGLRETAFRVNHDRGPADAKIRGATEVDPDRIGKGQMLNVKSVPTQLMARLERLLRVLGYDGLVPRLTASVGDSVG